jgi:hypothetical protein
MNDALSLLLTKAGMDPNKFNNHLESPLNHNNNSSTDDMLKSVKGGETKWNGVNPHQSVKKTDDSSSDSSSLSFEFDLAMSIVNITGCLPLTISIAAGLIESNGCQITETLVEMMKEDKLRSALDGVYDEETNSSVVSGGSGGSGGGGGIVSTMTVSSNGGLKRGVSLEDRLIKASLSMFMKNDSEQLAMACFLSFALYPEDIIVPAMLLDILAPKFVQVSNLIKRQSQIKSSSKVALGQMNHGNHHYDDSDSSSSSSSSSLNSFDDDEHGGGKGQQQVKYAEQLKAGKGILEVRKIVTQLVKVNLISGSYALQPFGFTVHDVNTIQ